MENKTLVLKPENGFPTIGRLTAVEFLRQALGKQHTIFFTKEIDGIIHTTECELISIEEKKGCSCFNNLKTTKQKPGEKIYLSCDIVPHRLWDNCENFKGINLHIGDHDTLNHYDDE